jgi:2-polyprenyl-6-methoxyphenol hydroxylase-like FAD-dependent oxidoreductase
VQVYEQASRFARIGAGIQTMPNSMQVLRGIGIEERVRATSFEPNSHLNRQWDTGEVIRELPMPESLFGAPYLCMHRGDQHEALLSVLPDEIIHCGRKLVGLDERGSRVTLTFEGGDTAEADAVVGADAVHSIVRELRKAYEGFHPDVRAVLESCPDCHKWAILEREPLPTWSEGRVVLPGDACHPMTPYMAQGAATAMEDAAVLARLNEPALNPAS